jgi:hypothetical protein
MKALAHPHDYMVMFYFAPLAVLYAALIGRIPPRGQVASLTTSLIIYGWALSVDRDSKISSRRSDEVVSNDFQNIYPHLPKNTIVATNPDDLQDMLPGLPYAPTFYLDQVIFSSRDDRSEYIVSRGRLQEGELLTKSNNRYFLYRPR